RSWNRIGGSFAALVNRVNTLTTFRADRAPPPAAVNTRSRPAQAEPYASRASFCAVRCERSAFTVASSIGTDRSPLAVLGVLNRGDRDGLFATRVRVMWIRFRSRSTCSQP